MDDAKTTMAPPVYVVDPPLPPEPFRDCDVCDALARQRTEATAIGDWSKVTDTNVEIGRHHNLSHHGRASRGTL
ncbi:hypothetical protein [Streptomyces sp. CA-146814]|uniref:hypothetical protein n=1 Tax=Streptomyces sp. CA-146814 TaxID=3240053 RepID=UPI003D9003FD